ncbi:MAG: GNAT family N-acetyltransferase [bacterium]
MNVKEIRHGSAEYQQECALRQEVMRKPLGLNLYDEDLVAERGQIHFGLFDEKDQLLACVIAVPVTATEAKVRQMAVRPSLQGKGCGRLLLEAAEQVLVQQGFTDLFLNSRMTAIGFYERLGYVRSGPEFMEVGMPHVKMRKTFSQTGNVKMKVLPLPTSDSTHILP